MSKRPRPKAPLSIDPDNAYARLGVSPLAATEEIRAFIRERRTKLATARRGKGSQKFGEEEAAMTELQEIERLIGSDKARAAYDAANPQNRLFTVQPSPRDRALEPRRAIGLVTRFVHASLGDVGWLPSAECAELWAPAGIDPEVRAVLERHTKAAPSKEPRRAQPTNMQSTTVEREDEG